MSTINTHKKWTTVKIPDGLLERVGTYAESDNARALGLVSRSQSIVYILRQFLEEHESRK